MKDLFLKPRHMFIFKNTFILPNIYILQKTFIFTHTFIYPNISILPNMFILHKIFIIPTTFILQNMFINSTSIHSFKILSIHSSKLDINYLFRCTSYIIVMFSCVKLYNDHFSIYKKKYLSFSMSCIC